ncbi:HAL protein kinase [Lipomyces arxii]|uniref:HAL protein kinase n=1 Tax=Lipomyces arxii TaxID=56418 RepID=UPI0034CF4898
MHVLKRATSSFSISSSTTTPSHQESTQGSRGSHDSSHTPPILPPNFEPPTMPLSAKYSSFNIGQPLRRNTIGKGATAVVRTVHSNKTHSLVYAVKEFHRYGAYDSESEYNAKLAVEFEIVKRLNHPNIVKTVDLCLGPHNKWCHVMEYCAGGDVYSLIKSLQEPMPARERNCLFKQLLRGVAYLHSLGIAHRDIKPENLLLTADGTLKISDFGVSFVVQDTVPDGPVKLCTKVSGSEPYISPEVFPNEEHPVVLYDARRLDVWSCAITYFCLTFGGHPFTKADNSDERYVAYHNTISDFHKEFPDVDFTDSETTELPKFRMFAPYSLACRRLLLRMLDPDPTRRCTIYEALNDSFTNRVEICCITADNDQDQETMGLVDASDKNSHKMMAKAQVRRVHNHLNGNKKKLTMPGKV